MKREVLRITGTERRRAWDQVATEAALEIRVGGSPLLVTMRTPRHDFELVAGLLVSERVVEGSGDIVEMRAGRGPDEAGGFDVVDVQLSPAAARRAAAIGARRVVTTSACGLCGATSLARVTHRGSAVVVGDDGPLVTPAMLGALPALLRAAQPGFERTGGSHAAGLFDHRGALVCAREDVGRHNAFDKVIGRALSLDGRLPLRSHLLLASGRASHELVHKAAVAGVAVLAAVSAPSSAAVDLATAAGLTLVGFLRGDTMNVYTGAHRVGG